jgi:hypothetical protein
VSGKWPELNPEPLASLAEGARPDHLTIEWREFQFARLGFENADEMARSDVDWHEAAALISAGATAEDVIRILL